MVGAPGSGKSTWIKKNHLEKYTVSADAIRSLVTTPANKIDPLNEIELDDYAIDLKDEGFTWTLLKDIVENRMRQGETTIVDATHLFKGSFTQYRELRKKYGYDVIVIDAMKEIYRKAHGDISAMREILYSQNASRDRQVAKEQIDKYLTRWIRLVEPSKEGVDHYPQWITYKGDTALSILPSWQYLSSKDCPSMNDFDTIQVIGDVHGDYSALEKVFENHHKGTAYVFVGDYLDRGTKNPETLEFMNSLKGKNIFLLRGNHEQRIEEFLQSGRLHGNFKNTFPQLAKYFGNDNVRDELQKLVDRLHNCLYFTFNNQTYLISHAGVDPIVMPKIPYHAQLLDEEVFTMGVSTDKGNPYNRDIDAIYGAIHNLFIPIQIHGHRNEFNHFDDCPGIYNLTKDGKFRWVTITKDGITPHEIDSIDKPTFVDELIADKDVVNKELRDGIVANNFTKETFEQGRWTPTTTNARGLFTRAQEIIGRGFPKFFNVGENEEATLESLEYPVNVYVKHNGFLAIAFYDKKEDKIQIFSKGGGEEYSTLAESILKSTGKYNDLVEYYKDDERLQETSVLFEIIDPIHDPHIVMYHMQCAYPLCVIENTENGRVLLDLAEKYWHIDDNLVGVAWRRKELDDIINKYMTEHSTTEGLVLYGQNKMLKIKTPFYLKAKELRTALAHHGKNRWYHGAENWFKHVMETDPKAKFTPSLAWDLYLRDVLLDSDDKVA